MTETETERHATHACTHARTHARTRTRARTHIHTPNSQSRTHDSSFVAHPVLPKAAPGDSSSGGHGTPVAGTIAGNASFGTAEEVAFARQYNGVAPLAKLVIDDMSDESEVGSLKVPEDLNEWLFPFSYAAGARIYVNAWGDDSMAYTSSAEEVDRFSYNHDDFLIFFAAGNAGKHYSISSPGTSKNALTVGAIDNSKYAFWDYGHSGRIGLYLRIDGGPPDSLGNFIRILPAEFGPNITVRDDRLAGSIAFAQPLLACDPLRNPPGSLVGKIVLAMRGFCPFQKKVNYIQRMGAALALVYNDVESTTTPIMQRSSDIPEPQVSAFSMSNREGEQLKSWLEESQVNVSLIHVYSSESPVEHLATYSSRGPAPGQRFKPDILCPGTLLRTASSDGTLDSNQCVPKIGDPNASVWEGYGTSFAVGVCAGAAALVRQYLRENHGFQSPPAALIKAILIHSGQPVLYNMTDHGRFGMPPSMPHFSQGYGMINLSTVLLPVGGLAPSASLWFEIDAIANATSSQTFCFSVSNAAGVGRVRATLTWTDFPAREGSNYPIVNDLDLSIVDPQVQ